MITGFQFLQPARVSFAVACACQSGNILEMDFEPFTVVTPPKSLSDSIGNGLEFLTRHIALTMFYDKEITKCLIDFLRHHKYKGKVVRLTNEKCRLLLLLVKLYDYYVFF
ncbi:hypothetical protein MTR67_051179 [Solanum verrucosum]|uniref:sucrose synthase n=1 Tax=Solanum verrucosum TaxID=315347 RepID=A0AAF0V5Z4_SOLVR|nr:hypothetical protein MTR67_051179 [Solanum verrucosum]